MIQQTSSSKWGPYFTAHTYAKTTYSVVRARFDEALPTGEAQKMSSSTEGMKWATTSYVVVAATTTIVATTALYRSGRVETIGNFHGTDLLTDMAVQAVPQSNKTFTREHIALGVLLLIALQWVPGKLVAGWFVRVVRTVHSRGLDQPTAG
jgi:hypothetical protein